MAGEEHRENRSWSRNKQAAFTVLWISFLSAAIGTMLFFAAFDPVELARLLDADLETGANAGYAIGFFFFWLLSAVCSGLTAFLIRTAPKKRKSKPGKR